MKPVRTRFAPSPTGNLHIGHLRTSLYAYAFAKSQGGKFILRIEDTDRRRFVPGATEKIYQMLKLFGISWDEGPDIGGSYGPYVQSERIVGGIYKQCAEKLVADNHAYYCFCPQETAEEIKKSHEKKEIILHDKCRNLTKEEARAKIANGEKPAIRLRVPENETISFYDFVLKKEISWETKDIDEVMLLKSDGFPTYHLGVTVDDAAMKISHIIRGREWLASTPVHLLLFKYLNFKIPEIGHFSLILDPSGGKLSKRKGSISLEAMFAQGYLPEAILNFVMLLGWAPKDNREIFSLPEFVAAFNKGNIQVANAIFNPKKLDWFNGQYIRLLSDSKLFTLLKPFAAKGMDDELIKKTIPLVKERITRLADYTGMVDFFVKEPEVDLKLLIEKAGGDKSKILEQFKKSLTELAAIKTWEAERLEEKFRSMATKENYHLGKFFMGLRIAITGKTITPPLFESMAILGREETLARLEKAVKILTE